MFLRAKPFYLLGNRQTKAGTYENILLVVIVARFPRLKSYRLDRLGKKYCTGMAELGRKELNSLKRKKFKARVT